MADMMLFPETWEEFEKDYGFTDTDEVYTNGARLIPSFRVEQWLEHLDAVQKKHDAVSREELLNILNGRLDFLKKWKDETTDFEKIAEAKIEDCEEIIDIIKSYENTYNKT